MEKLFSFILIAALAAPWSVKANIDPSTGMEVVSSKSGFLLFYKAETFDDVMVKIYDAQGKRVYQEKIRHIDSFIRPYNLETLGEGEYRVELSNRNGTLVKEVTFQRKKMELRPRVLGVEGATGKYVLSVPSNGSSELNIRIFDKNGRLVHSEYEETSGDFARVYDLRQFNGTLVFKISDSMGNQSAVSVH